MERYASPAEYVVYLFGGVRATARLLKCNPATVTRWTKGSPTSSPNARGLVPAHFQKRVIEIAAEWQPEPLYLTAEHLLYGAYIVTDDPPHQGDTLADYDDDGIMRAGVA